MKEDFFHRLRTKTQVKPSRSFDREFWHKFESEFPQDSWLDRLIQLYRYKSRVPAFLTLLVLGSGSYLLFTKTNPTNLDPKDGVVLFEAFELIEDFEFAEGLEDDLLVSIDEEDWAELLPEEQNEG